MQSDEDQYMDRTADLVAKIRAMRQAAEKEMNRFTRVADYDVRRVVGQKPKASPVSVATASVEERVGVPAETFTPMQTLIEPLPGPEECGDDEEAHQ